MINSSLNYFNNEYEISHLETWLETINSHMDGDVKIIGDLAWQKKASVALVEALRSEIMELKEELWELKPWMACLVYQGIAWESQSPKSSRVQKTLTILYKAWNNTFARPTSRMICLGFHLSLCQKIEWYSKRLTYLLS